MRYLIHSKQGRKYTIFIILLCLIFGNLNGFFYKQIMAAEEDTGDWVITDAEGKIVLGDRIKWVGTHNAGTDGFPRYRTMYYNISRKWYDTTQKFTSGHNGTITKKDIQVRVRNQGEDIGDEKIRDYSISRTEFLYAATHYLKITADDVLSGNAEVYLNPVYERYVNYGHGEVSLVSEVFGLQEMLALVWSEDTERLLPNLYNVKYTITANNLFNVKVIAVDENNNSLDGAVNVNGVTIRNPLSTDKLIAYQPYEYTVSDANMTLKLNGESYTYNHYRYEYKQRSPEVSKTVGNYTSKEVLINEVPDVKPDTTMTIYLVYGQKPYYVDYVAVDEERNTIADLSTVGYDVYSGKTYTYKIPEEWKIRGNNKYTNRWYLTYVDKNNIEITMPVKNSTDISQVMPEAMNYSKAKFNLIYSTDITEPPITPPGGPTITPAIPKITPPAPDYASLEFTDVVNTGEIRADLRGGERFVAPLGVPTTESLFGEVTAKEYLLGYSFVKKVGIEYFPVEVTKYYILTWKTATPASAGGGITVTDRVPVKQTISVPRAYGYWEIENLECYKIDRAVLQNYALPNGQITIYPNYSYYSPPSVSFYHSESTKYHIIPPKEVEDGILLEDEVIMADASTPTKKPNVKNEDFSYFAQMRTGMAKVKSDSLIFNGSTVISDEVLETVAPNINVNAIPQCNTYISNNVLYRNNLIIDATKKNGTYPSSGTITYTSLAKVRSVKPEEPQYSIDGVNTVVIQTPVICNPSITADNDKYVQLINPNEGCVQLVLDTDITLSDFTVNISNIGFHTGKQGYFTRDFSYALRSPTVSYIASKSGLLRNEVKFPFDVYVDVGNDHVKTNDDYIKAGTWVTIGRASPRFYLPAWTTEGTYIVDFRTVAVNGEDSINQTEKFANTSLTNYVATETLNVEISGRIYGLTLYDISDYPIWKEAFRVPDTTGFKKDFTNYIDGTNKANYNKQYAYTYRLGTNDQYSNDTGRDIKYTFPLVNGSHPFYKNQGILKTGYMVRFSLDTIGSMFSDACSVTLKPSFYFVDENGGNRTAVDLYYTEEISGNSKHLVKVGSALDKTNIKEVMTGDLNLGIPASELKQTAALRGMKYGSFIANMEAMFTISNIRLNYAFRTYVGQEYAAGVRALSSYGDVVSSGYTQENAARAVQRWYGQYYIPNEVHVVAKDYDVMGYANKSGVDYSENFWLTDGYIIVNFTIETVDESGKRRLSYINAANYRDNGNCSMWITEGPALSKTSYKGPAFHFYAGDFIIYYANKKMSDDYSSGSIY